MYVVKHAFRITMSSRFSAGELNLNSEIHGEAKKTKRLLSLKGPGKLHMTSLTPIGRALSIAYAQWAAKVGSLFFYVYHGAKRLTLSANSFPSRVVVSRIANAFFL